MASGVATVDVQGLPHDDPWLACTSPRTPLAFSRGDDGVTPTKEPEEGPWTAARSRTS
jgi:hypothetical protein